MKNERINWDNYFFNIVKDISLRSTCLSRKVGAIIVKDKRILATGYNGAVIGSEHCIDIDICKRKELKIESGKNAELCKGVHAEQNAIIQCAKYGVECNNSTMYVSCSPCSICFKMIVNTGIKTIKFLETYNDDLVNELINQSGYICKDNIIFYRNF